MSEVISSLLEQYIQENTSLPSDFLVSLERKTYTDVLQPHMISGHVQGRVLSILSKMMRPRAILEIGTFTAYSAICLAEGLAPNGKLITVDVDEEKEDLVKNAIREAGFEGRIIPMLGQAAEIIPTLEEEWDLVFIDADKSNYGLYFDLVIDKVRSGGIILADNTLWKGKVVDERADRRTASLINFNRKVQEDNRVENVILSVRDGISLIYKK